MTRRKGKSNDRGGPSPSDRTIPEWMDATGDHGPLTVLLMSPAHQDGKLPTNPFIIARSMKEQVGAVSSAYRNKDGNLVVKVRSAKKASKLMELSKLIDGTEVKVEEHARLNQSRCIVTCHSVSDLSEEELAKELADQGIIQVHRLGRKGGKSATMVLTLRGTVVPKEVFFGYDCCPTREYKQSPMQCFRCFDYGHTKARCTAEAELCRNCSGTHQITKDKDGKTVCESAAKCKHCSGGHSPTSRICPKYVEEDGINEIRTKEDKSVREARRLFEERKATAGSSSYAGVANSGNSDARAAETLKKQLESTQGLLQKALKEIASLKEAEAARNEQNRTTERELLIARRLITELKAARDNKNGKNVIVTDSESEEESDGESVMEVVEAENPKRPRPDSDVASDDSESNLENVFPASGKPGDRKLKPIEKPTPKDIPQETQKIAKNNKKAKTSSGQEGSATPTVKPKKK